MTDYLIKEDVFMTLTGDITDCTIEEFIARLRDKLSKLPSVGKDINVTTNEDCISRQAVLELVGNYDLSMGQVVKAIHALPPVKPKEKTRWIPVTEDAPPKGTICLWCNKQGSVFISEITYRSESSSYVGKHGYFSNGLENYGDIVAWMPSPEPYKAESE